MHPAGVDRAAARRIACATCSPTDEWSWHIGRNYVRLGPGKSHCPEDRRMSTMTEQWFERDPLWFKRAVFYEIHIRGFFDGNDDGSGDFRGLIDKLDFLAVARRRLHLAAADVRARRSGTAATTSRTSSRSTPTTGRSTTSASSSTRRTSAACA